MKVQKYRSGQISEEAPGASFNTSMAGAMPLAVADLGGEFAEFATRLQAQRTQAEAGSFSSNTLLDYKRELQERQISEKSVREDGEGYSRSLQDFQNAWMERIKEGAPTDLARQQATGVFVAEAKRDLIEADAYEYTQKALAHEKNYFTRSAESAKFFQDFPKQERLIDHIRNLETSADLLSPSVWSSSQADQNYKAAANEAVKSFFSGLAHSSSLRDPMMGLAILESESEEFAEKGLSGVEIDPMEAAGASLISMEEAEELMASGQKYSMQPHDSSLVLMVKNKGIKLSDFLSPEDKIRVTRELRAASKTKNTIRIKNYLEIDKDIDKALLTGEAIDISDVNARDAEGLELSSDNPQQQMRILHKSAATRTANIVLRELGTTPRSQWDGLSSLVKAQAKMVSQEMSQKHPDQLTSKVLSSFGSRVEINATEVVRQARGSIIKKQNKQAADYVVNSSPGFSKRHVEALAGSESMQKFIRDNMNEQIRLEIPGKNRKFLTTELRKELSRGIGRKNPEHVIEAAMANLVSKTGRYHRLVAKELGIPSDTLGLVPFTEGQESRQVIISNYKNEASINKDFNEDKGSKEILSDADQHLEAITRDARAALYSANQGGALSRLSGSFQKNSELEMKRLISQDKLKDPKKIAEAAFSKIWGNKVGVLRVGDNNAVMYPLTSASGTQNSPQKIQATIEYFTTPDGMKKLPISLDDKVQINALGDIKALMAKEFDVQVGTGARGVKVTKSKDAFFNMLSKRAAWVQDDEDSMKLMYLKSNGTMVEVKGSDGNKITMDFEDITTRTHPDVLKSMRSYFDKFLDLF